jgi:hypothetical protein
VARVLLKGRVNAVTSGIGGDLLDSIWAEWDRGTDARQRREEVEALAQMSYQQARQQAAAAVAEEVTDEPIELRLVLTSFLTQMPSQARRSLRRPNDPAGTTVPPELTPRRGEDLKGLLPDRLPRFKAGDRPLPGVPWVLQELLGVGGFGEVWQACHVRFPGLQAALKFCLDPAARDRLLHHEAKVVLQVQRQGKHPGMVELRQAYLDTDPPCLEYEYIDGGELTDWVRHHPLTPRQASEVIVRLAGTVGFAHRLAPAVVHRDLKPANVLIQKVGTEACFKVADFGIGDLLHSQPRPGGASRPTILGGAFTHLYASPQQRAGLPPDVHDDVYALGVIWYHTKSHGIVTVRGTESTGTRRGIAPRPGSEPCVRAASGGSPGDG